MDNEQSDQLERIDNKTFEKKFDAVLTRMYYGAIIVALGLIIAFNIVSSFDVIPRFCGQCHQTVYARWSQSKHAEVKCRVCHNGPTVFGTVSGRVRLAGMIPAALTSYYQKPITTYVPSNVCMECHESIKTKIIRKDLLIVSHKEIIDAGYECSGCHSSGIHQSSSNIQNQTTMDKCLACHNNITASGKCEVCHTKTQVVMRTRTFNGPWQITHGKNWRSLHGMGNLSTCRTCHSKLYCVRCHSIELPHPDAWLATHGKLVVNSETIKNSCSKCHQGSLCKNCHNIQIPHPSEFLNQHSKLVKKNGAEVCYGCHLKEACSKCHSYHVHPGIPKEKLKLLKKKAGLE